MCEREFRLEGVESVRRAPSEPHIVYISFCGGVKGKVTFLEENIFRYDVDPEGEFPVYAKPAQAEHTARIQQRPDESEAYTRPGAEVEESEGFITILCGNTSVSFDKAAATLRIRQKDRVVMEEAKPLAIKEGSVVQTLIRQKGEDFYGGGTQNGRFLHTGKKIQIVNDDKLTIGPNITYIPRHLTDYTADCTITKGTGSVDGPTSDGSRLTDFTLNGSITVHNALKVGEKVHVLSFNHGKQYYLLDRTEG